MANIHHEHSSANQAFPHLIKSETKFLNVYGPFKEAREQIKKSVSLWLPEFKASEEPGASTSQPAECPQVCCFKVTMNMYL